jgi:hypothetical protein
MNVRSREIVPSVAGPNEVKKGVAAALVRNLRCRTSAAVKDRQAMLLGERDHVSGQARRRGRRRGERRQIRRGCRCSRLLRRTVVAAPWSDLERRG